MVAPVFLAKPFFSLAEEQEIGALAEATTLRRLFGLLPTRAAAHGVAPACAFSMADLGLLPAALPGAPAAACGHRA